MKMIAEKTRKDFPILKRKINGYPLVYLDNAATTQKPEKVIEAVSDFYRKNNANPYRGIHVLADEATVMVENARDKIAGFIGAKSSKEIVFVRNATEGINGIMRGWGEGHLGKGDAVIISMMEHHANLVTWQQLCKKTGTELRVLETDKDGEVKWEGKEMEMVDGVMVGSWEKVWDEKVKLVAVTGMSNVLGVEMDIEEIVKRTKGSGVRILIDGSQLVPQKRVQVGKMRIDFLVFSGHKMMGPMGVGVVWAKEEVWKETEPFAFGGEMISEVGWGESKWNEMPMKMEAGTINAGGIVGLGAAVDYLEGLGMEKVEGYEKELVTYAMEKLEKLEKEGLVEIYGSRDIERKGGVISFNVKGVHAHDTAQVLDSFGVAVRSGFHCAQPLVESLGQVAVVRMSFYVYNTKEEIKWAVEKLKEVKKILGK